MKIIQKFPLLNCSLYSSGVYNNCFYKMINPCNKEISLYNNNIENTCNINTCNLYYAICLFKTSYIASKKDVKDKLYKISKCFKEYEETHLEVPKEYLGTILSIYYDECNNKILIATENKVYSVTLDGHFIKNEFTCCQEFKKIEYQSQYVRDLNGCCRHIEKKVEKCEAIITFVGIFCNKKYIGITKDNSAFLLELSNNGNVVNKYYIDDDIKINSIINCNGIMTLLITKDEKYNYIYFLNITCKRNNRERCNKCHCEKEKCDLIESVALIETALSHILNSEGEKLQKVLKETNNICEILKTNDSINKTIINTTMLEQILYEKLKLVTKE